jgi:citrate lyase alpha subunit
MAKKQKVNKSQAVRDYAEAHPEATSGEIAAALNRKGITITANYAANIKSQSKKKRRATKAKKPQMVEAVAAVTEETTVKAGATVTLEHVKAVALTTRNFGGSVRLYELLGLIKEVGGLKKFKDLLEAISGTETDSIPF